MKQPINEIKRMQQLAGILKKDITEAGPEWAGIEISDEAGAFEEYFGIGYLRKASVEADKAMNDAQIEPKQQEKIVKAFLAWKKQANTTKDYNDKTFFTIVKRLTSPSQFNRIKSSLDSLITGVKEF